jgi:signal transduction histidine kinase
MGGLHPIEMSKSHDGRCNLQTQCIREQERARIAREIHDELSQLLTAIRIEAYLLMDSVKTQDPAVKEQLLRMTAVANETSRALERIGTELRPEILNRLGLAGAIEWQAREFEKRAGITSGIVVNGRMSIDADFSLNIFRLYQEALANVARHSGASRVDTQLELKDNILSLGVSDNGRGFDLNRINRECALGITGMKERATMLGGDLQIESSIGKGTTVCLTIPILRRHV